MRNGKTLRNIALAVAAVMAIGIAAYASGGGAENSDERGTTAGSLGAVAPSGVGADAVKSQLGEGFDGDDAAREEMAAGDASNSASGVPGQAPLPAGGGTLATTVDRKIVSTASVQLQVENVGGSFEEVLPLCSACSEVEAVRYDPKEGPPPSTWYSPVRLSSPKTTTLILSPGAKRRSGF